MNKGIREEYVHPYGLTPYQLARLVRLKIKLAVDEVNLQCGTDVVSYPPHVTVNGECWSWGLLEKLGEDDLKYT